MLKPMFIYVGGKRKEIKRIKDYIPTDIDTYLEPFVGAGALYFHLNHDKSVISDVNTEVIDFYNCIQEGKAGDIYNFMEEYKSNKETYFFIRDNFEIKSTLDNACRFFYIRCNCFRGMISYNKAGKFDVYFDSSRGTEKHKDQKYYSYLLNPAYQNILKNTEILNKDFSYVFENYNSSENFMFLDPPYLGSRFENYGYSEFGKEEHERLANYFKTTNIRCLMIINKTPFIEKLYKDYIIEEYGKIYDMNSRNTKKKPKQHLIVANYFFFV